MMSSMAYESKDNSKSVNSVQLVPSKVVKVSCLVESGYHIFKWSLQLTKEAPTVEARLVTCTG